MTEEPELIQSLESMAYIINESQGKAVVTMLNGDLFQEAANEIRELHKTLNTAIKLLQEKHPYQQQSYETLNSYLQHLTKENT